MEEDFLAIRRHLDSKKVDYEAYEHGPIRTSEEASRIRGEPMHTGVKSLVFKADLGRSKASSRFQNAPHSENDELILVLIPGDRKADWSRLRAVTGAKNVRMATPEEVLAATNCEVGSVHPFSILMPARLKTFMERSILQNDRINFSAGLLTMSIKMNPQDLKEAAQAEVADLVKP